MISVPRIIKGVMVGLVLLAVFAIYLARGFVIVAG